MMYLTPGTVVSVQVGPVEHYGVVSDLHDGITPYIISNSRRTGRVAEERVSIFSEGKDIKVHGYPSKLSPAMAIARAKSQLGKAYDVLNWNCEHFVRWVHGLKVESPQLQAAVISGLVILCCIYFAKKS